MSFGTEPVSAHDVAREIGNRLLSLGEVKLHKLLYYCQGWHLAWTGVPLFSEEIEAWANGPVVAELWRDRKHDRARPEPRDLDASMLGTVGYVVSRYGSFSGTDLIRLTHNEDPWRDAAEQAALDQWRDETIGIKELQSFFEKQDAKTSDARRLLSNPAARQRQEGASTRTTAQPAGVDNLDSLRALVHS